MDRPLTGALKSDGTPLTLDEYERIGGYASWRRVLRELAPADIQKLVTESNLRGRGGAGFVTGQKWSFVPMGPDAPQPKYFIVNADEMEPGTYKDRLLLEGNPHQVLEGTFISARAIEARHAYIFIRWAYRIAALRLKNAIAEAYSRGLVGTNIQGTGVDLDIHLHVSAGRYICGEETALLNALEGKRAIPRSKPPYPQVSGLWGKPTIVNNVETVANVPHIVEKGADWFKGLGRGTDSGTKLYGASGNVRQPGLWELPIGTTAREILEDHAGSMRDGYRFRGLLPGGASTDFLVEDHLDVPLDFDAVQKAGSRLGTGTMIVLDDRTCPVGMVRNLEKFFAQESCGWCTPCRDGLPWTARVLDALEDGTGEAHDLQRLELHTKLLGPGRTFCALAPGAMEPLQSALKYFRDDFERHIAEHRCPWER